MNVNYIYGSFYIKQNEQHDPDLHINAMTKFKVRPFIFTNYNVKLSLSVVYFWYYGALGLCGSLVIYWYQFSFLEISRNKLNSNYKRCILQLDSLTYIFRDDFGKFQVHGQWMALFRLFMALLCFMGFQQMQEYWVL